MDREEALPRRWTRWQRAKNTGIYRLVRGLHAGLRLVPLSCSGWLARGIGQVGWWISREPRRMAAANLAQAFPELDRAARRRIARRSFDHLARTAVELIHVDRLERCPKRLVLGEDHRRLLDEAVAEGRGVVLVSGHLGNWELIPPLLSSSGYPLTVVARKLYDPRLTSWVHELRTRHGVEVLWRGDADLTRRILAVFRRGGIFGCLIDQDTDVQGVLAPFFGRDAFTPTAAASLALRVGAPVLVCWTWREDGRHRLHMERVPAPSAGSDEERVRELTATLNAHLERAIRRVPEQWVWLHDRWKRCPREAACSGARPPDGSPDS